jgi:putative ABC transport system permease protein
MIKNYFKIAFRNLQRNRKHAVLNILGLAVALAACMIIFLVLQFEYSYNKHLENYDNIYQVVSKFVDGEGEHHSGGVPFPTIKHLRQDFPQYSFAELMQYSDVQVTARNEDGDILPDKKFFETSGVFYGDAELMKLFEVKFIRGNADILKDVNSIAISKSTAEKYFGNTESAFGKRLNFNNAPYDYQVAAIFHDAPAASDFPFRIVAPYAGFISKNVDGWPLDGWGANTSNHQVYVMLPPGVNTKTFNQQLSLLEKKYNKEQRKINRTQFLHPLANIHFDERFEANGEYITNKSTLFTLSFIGLLIILMACINFVNLSTALAITRGKEVGIRRVLGGGKLQLRFQVFMETAVIVCLAALAAFGLATLALPYVKNIMDVQTRLNLLNTGSLSFIIITIITTTILSASYPAFVMGRFRPVEAIKNRINTMRVGSVSLRRVLVVLQFAFSQVLIIATIIAIGQMNFIRNADLGFNKESVLNIGINSDSASLARHTALKNDLVIRSDVKMVSFGFDAPSSDNSWTSNFAFDKMDDPDFGVDLKMGDENYLATYGLQLIAGKFYEASDTATGIVVNQTFLTKVGVRDPKEAIGKMMRIGGWRPKPVVGVVKDFKTNSLRDIVPPIAIIARKSSYNTVGIKLASANLSRSRDEIREIWNRHFPEYVYDASFLDEKINNFYLQEQRLSLMYKVYALLAIFISCLGLYGLVSFMVVQKTKEVGIRKVLGANVGNIVYLFSKEFTILVSIAFVIAAPAAWFLMHSWLQDFQFRIPIGPGVFIISIFISICIAWMTVGYKALRAAVANPVKALRSE